jgi:hypothetical protein
VLIAAQDLAGNRGAMQPSAPLTVLLALLSTAPAALAGIPAPDTFQKISIVESSNLKLDDRYRTLRLPESPDSPELRQLREHVLKQVDLTGLSDPELILAALEWVSIQWDHDGLNEPPQCARPSRWGADERSIARGWASLRPWARRSSPPRPGQV